MEEAAVVLHLNPILALEVTSFNHVFSWVTEVPSLSSIYEIAICSVQYGGHLPHVVI